jgi:aminoglycoside phosphotransferase (APT) family kinase protein
MVDPVRESKTLTIEITRILGDAFPAKRAEGLSVIAGGLSGATVLGFSVEGVDYVLRQARPMFPGDEVRLDRGLVCLEIASQRGVAPRLRHVDRAARVSIMERVHATAPDRSKAGASRYLSRVASKLRRLHDGPAFPQAPTVSEMVRQLDVGLPRRGAERLPEVLVRTMNEVTTATADFATAAPCHNDLNPGNILETDDSVYFVDWETAAQSDPFFDLAELGVFGFPTPDARAELLEAYLARRPTAEEQARATVARVMALGFYAAGFIHVSVAAGGSSRPVAAPLPISDVLTLLGTSRERVSPDGVAASLIAEMQRESETDSYQAARAMLEGAA